MLKILIDATDRKNKKISLIKVENAFDTIVSDISGDVDLVPALDMLLNENGIKLDQVSSFDLVDGKGSFTGIKNAAAIVNILKWSVTNTPIDKLNAPNYGGDPNIQK